MSTKPLDLLKTTYQEWSANKAPRLAAALAYYTLFALAPLLVIVVQLGALAIGFGQAHGHHHQIQATLLSHLKMTLGPSGAQAVADMVQATVEKESAGWFSSLLGYAMMMLAAGGLFGSLQDALNTIWEVPSRTDQRFVEKVKERFATYAMVGGIAFLLLVSLLLNGVVQAFGDWALHLLPQAAFFLTAINLVVAALLATLLFAMIFKILPDIKLEWRDVWVGAIITTVLFGLGQVLLGLYIANVGLTSTYGAAGSLAVILVWVYYSAQILLFGAEFTRVYALRVGSRKGSAEEKGLDEPTETAGLQVAPA